MGSCTKFDEEGMRDAYLVDGVYAVGDMVENVNTGLVGEVTRRGTNYIIAVTGKPGYDVQVLVERHHRI